MNKYCTYCGAQIDNNVKLCPECGRLVGIENRSAGASYTPRQEPPRRVYEHPNRQPQSQAQRPVRQAVRTAPRPEQEYYEPEQQPRVHPEHKKKKHKKQKKPSKVFGVIKKLIIAAVLIGAIYGLLAFVNITLVKRAGYEFNTPMKLEQDCYGDAVDVYFKEGRWSFNLLTFTVSYEGTANNGDKYEMKFGHEKGQTIVKEMTVNGKEIKQKDIMSLYVLGMFNSVEIKTDK